MESQVKEDEDTTYITKRFLKIVKRNEGFPRKGNSRSYTNANDMCQKYGKPGHFLKDCPLHKVEYNKYIKTASDREKIHKVLYNEYIKTAGDGENKKDWGPKNFTEGLQLIKLQNGQLKLGEIL